MTAVAEIEVAAAVDAWERIGLRVHAGAVHVGGVAIRLVTPASIDDTGIRAWTLAQPAPAADAPAPERPASIDGLPTTWVDADAARPGHVDHPLGAIAIDHVVVMTSSLERTCAAIEASTGEPLKRIREAGAVRQGFHRLGPVIVEVVESATVTSTHARFWGLVLVVEDLHEAAGRLGPDVVSHPKSAVQPGRFIASFRAEAGLGLPVAIMSR